MTAPSQVMIGQEQRVKIELRNPGTGDATGVMLFENVPQNVKHAAGPALEFEIGTLRAGETRELELVLTAEKAGTVVNVLTARADGNLQVQQQVEFEVIAPALAARRSKGPERRYLERPATYQVIVENPGTAPAHDIELVTKLPKGMQFVSANNMGEYDAATHAVYWSLAELPEGEKGTVELVAMPIEAGPANAGSRRQGPARPDRRNASKTCSSKAWRPSCSRSATLEDPIEVGGETTLRNSRRQPRLEGGHQRAGCGQPAAGHGGHLRQRRNAPHRAGRRRRLRAARPARAEGRHGLPRASARASSRATSA